MRYYLITANKGTFRDKVDGLIRTKQFPKGTRFVFVEGQETLAGLEGPGEVLFATDWHHHRHAKDIIRRLQLRTTIAPVLLEEVGL